MNDKLVIKLSLMCTVGGSFIAQKGLDITDEDIKKLSSLVDRIIKILEDEANESVRS